MTMRLGVLGCGRQAGIAIARACVPPWQVGLVGGRDLGRARAFITTHGLRDADACSLEDVIRGEVDAVYIGLPNQLHEQWTLDALRAGKSVLVEKPLALSLAGCSRIEDARRACGLTVLEGIMIQHHPWVARLQRSAAELGAVRAVRTDLAFAIPPERLARLPTTAEGGGVLRDVAPYWLFLVSLVAPLDAVTVEVADVRDDAAEVSLRTANGIHARLRASYRGPYCARHAIDLAAGQLTVPNIFRVNLGPQHMVIECRTPTQDTREQIGGASAFTEQLRAFASLCCGDEPARAAAMASALVRQRLVDEMLAR
jgi:dTDP-3,4-didehydro-2,6-dideoxy-alpha-D-glucose 3-reductase